MSGLIYLYLIDEDQYPTSLTGDDAIKHQTLLDITEQEATLWQSMELNQLGFMSALEVLDGIMGNSRLLPICTYHFFPHELIGPDADIDDSFGYFPPAMVKDLFAVMQKNYDVQLDTPDAQAVVTRVESTVGELNEEAYELVRDAYFVTFRDAAEQEKAVVVLMEA